ncbi:hypothetical protein Taro_009891 [Colocasia esculenta]|uniref:Uncharacterized protein n=1 Tax=Colocasia esculenta TaxID=4460 RepID=A0A843U7V3_COLES|nr:hypothetical protein [Colocasia esculenta]
MCLLSAPLEAVAPISVASFDLREEYASAFRTESYAKFWARVLEQTFACGVPATHRSTDRGGSSADAPPRLPSCNLLVESLLEPDQPTVAKVLAHARGRRGSGGDDRFLLISDFFSETENASLLCGLLLKDIEGMRLCYRPLKKTLNSLASSGDSSPEYGGLFQAIANHLADLSKARNPFSALTLSQRQLQSVQSGSASLLKRLESGRRKARSRLRLLSRVKRGLAILLVALTASTSVVGACVALHAVVALTALSPLLPVPLRLASTRWVRRVVTQLDAAAKGTYILSRDLDTIGRLVARLQDEVEHMLAMLRFCFERRHERLRPTQEVVRQLKKNEASFNQQLDELEEHLYLCFVTINKARRLVMKEVLPVHRL